ncbi:ATP-binding protein [Streptomyces violaceusniger]|uniref:ATP-binding protein n=1 Tax=Streptomyces violaceusniger TaxID=68280 RepID=UPI003436B020
MDEALRRVREKRSELPQLPSVPGLRVRRHVRGVVARMTASAVTLGAVRELVGTVPVECGADRKAAENAQLVVSELIGNAVRVCGDGVQLLVEAYAAADGGVTVIVRDPRGDLLPTRRKTAMDSDDAECGRGLHLLDVLAPGWTVGRLPIGKQIRCHIEKGCSCGPNDKCRCPHPIPPETAASANDVCPLCEYSRCRCGGAFAAGVTVKAGVR